MAKRKTKTNVMQDRGLVKRGVPLKTKVVNGKRVPATVWRKPSQIVRAKKRLPKTTLSRAAFHVGKRIMEMENFHRTKLGQAVRNIFDPKYKRKLRVVKVAGQKLYITPSKYVPYIASVRFTERLPQKFKALLAKKGKLLSTAPFLIGAGAGVMSLGGKYIMVPLRPTTVGVHAGKFHWVAGMSEYDLNRKGPVKFDLPFQTAGREPIEELGVNKIEFLGPGLKSVSPEKAPALIMLQDLNINMFEIQHAMNVKVGNADKFIENNFKKKSGFKDEKLKGGMYEFVGKAKDKWEMKSVAIFPRNSKSIFYFLRENRGKITPAARLGLLAYAAELRKIERNN